MKTRTTFMLLLLTVLLGAFIWFFDRAPGTSDERRERARKVLRVSAGDVLRLGVVSEAVTVHCEKKGDAWEMTAPVRARADGGEIDRILWVLEDLERSDVITAREMSKQQLSRSDYGLDQPRAKITLDQGRQRRTFLVGRDAPVGDAVFVMEEGGEDIYVVPGRLRTCLPQDLASLRDRRVFEGGGFEVNKIEVHRPGGFLQVLRSGDDTWAIQQPLVARADYHAVREWLDGLYDLRIEEFVADEVAEPAAYGFADDAPSVTLWMEEDGAEQTLMIGNMIEDSTNRVYAKVDAFDSVYAVASDLVEDLNVEVDSLRDRRLLTFDAHEVMALRVEQGESSVGLKKDAGDVWQVVEPVTFEADEDQVDRTLNGWAGARIEAFIDEPDEQAGLAFDEMSSLRVVFSTGSPGEPAGADEPEPPRPVDQTVLQVLTETEGGGAVVRVEGEPSLYRVDGTLFGLLSVDGLFFRDRDVLRLAADDIRSISVTRDGQTEYVERDERGVFSAGDEREGRVDSDAVRDILAVLGGVRALRFVDENPDDPARYGLAEPACMLTLGLTGESGIEKTLLLGAAADGEGVYAMIRGDDVVFVAERALFAMLQRPLLPSAPSPEE